MGRVPVRVGAILQAGLAAAALLATLDDVVGLLHACCDNFVKLLSPYHQDLEGPWGAEGAHHGDTPAHTWWVGVGA